MFDTTLLRVVRSVDPALPVGTQLTIPPDGGEIGRSPEVSVCLPGSTVSRRHARLERGAHGWDLTGLTSSNAVFVDGEALEGTAPLPLGTPFQLGGVVCILVDDAGTSPVLERIDQPLLLEVRLDGEGCSAHANGALLPLAQQEARVLGALVECAGRPVHRWDLEELFGGSVNLDKVVSRLRAGLRTALEEGLLPRAEIAGLVDLPEGEPADLVRRLIVTRRGHGYLLTLPPHRCRLERV